MALTRPPSARRRPTFSRVNIYRRPSYVLALLVVLAVLLLGEAPVAAYQVAHLGRVYPGVHALGIDLGGKTDQQAREVLLARFETYANSDFKLHYGDRTWDTTPGELGVRLDVNSLVGQAMEEGRRGAPFEHLPAQLNLLLRGRDLNPVVSTDSSRLTMVLGALAHDFDRPVRDARLEISEGGDVTLLSSQDGSRLDVALTAARFLDSFRYGDSRELTAIVHVSPARVRDEDLAETRRTAETMLAGDAVLTYGDQEWTWGRGDLARAVAIEGQDPPTGPIHALFLDDVLVRMAEDIARALDRAPKPARLTLQGVTVRLESAEPGIRTEIPLTVEKLKASLLAGERRVAVITSALPPAVDDAALQPARAQAARILAAPLVFRSRDKSWTWTPEQLAGMLALPNDAPRPGTRPETTLDREKLRGEIGKIAKDLEVAVREYEVKVSLKPNPVYEIVPGAEGRKVDVDALADLVTRQAETDRREFEVPLQTVKPMATEEQMRAAIARANQMVGAPMTLRYGPNRWELSTNEIVDLMDFWSAPNVPDPHLSQVRLVAYLGQLEDAIRASLPADSPPVGLDIDQAVRDITQRVATDNRTVDLVLRLRLTSAG